MWLAFSGGGVMAAVFLPVLAFLFALAFPLGWIDPPDHDQIAAVVGHPMTFLVLLGLFPVILSTPPTGSATRSTTASRSSTRAWSRCCATAGRWPAASPPWCSWGTR